MIICISMVPLSAPVHNYGDVFAGVFFHHKTLDVDWIRFFISFFIQIESNPWIIRYCIYETMY